MNTKDPKKTTPVFLLAYIAYNTGSEQQAAGYLTCLISAIKTTRW